MVKELLSDKDIFYAIDNKDNISFENADELVYKYIFPFKKNTETIKETITFLAIMVHIPKTYGRNNTWVSPTLEILIVSHEDHMKVDNIPKIPDNRNDYISKLIDKKFNGKDTFGNSKKEENNLHILGKLDLISNVEGSYSTPFLYRQMIFEMKDLNNSLCEDDE